MLQAVTPEPSEIAPVTTTVRHIVLLAGPSGGGKSTFIKTLQEGRLSSEVASALPDAVTTWPVIDVTNRMRRDIDVHGPGAVLDEIGAPSGFILHYDITTIHRYGIAGYASDPGLRLLERAEAAQSIFVCPDAARLLNQFVSRDAQRRKRKSGLARGWNAAILHPLRRLRGRLSGQVLNSEHALYSDPHWLERCYGAWEAYIGSLMAQGKLGSLVRVEPCRGEGAEPEFRIVPGAKWPAATSGA